MRVFHLDQVCALLHQKVERVEVAQERGQVGRGPTLMTDKFNGDILTSWFWRSMKFELFTVDWRSSLACLEISLIA